MAASNVACDLLVDLLVPTSLESLFMFFFLVGFVLIRFGGLLEPAQKKGKMAKDQVNRLHKTIETEMASGNPGKALTVWRKDKDSSATPQDTLVLVTQALVDQEPLSFTKELVENIAKHRTQMCNHQTFNAVLDVVARAGLLDSMEELAADMKERFHVKPSHQTYEVLLGGYATAGKRDKVLKVMSVIQSRGKISPRGFSLTIQGFLKSNMIDAAWEQVIKMHSQKLSVPTFAVTQLIQRACEAGQGAAFFGKALSHDLPLTSDAVASLFEECFKKDDLAMALKVETGARAHKVPLLKSSFDPYLKLCVMHADVRALALFKEMQETDSRISEGLCVGLLTRCAETKFLRFAEEIARYVRGKGNMSIAVYSALMKVYAYSKMYDKACDLYSQIKTQGLEPDSIMYGCLIRFAVECGRTDLSRELFKTAPTLDIQSYMSLIKAAGRDKDIDQAFDVLQKLRDSGAKADITAYNCLLDVCVSVGDMKRARMLMQEMKHESAQVDVISYNIILKGFCSKLDIEGAKATLSEMRSVGLHPNVVSFNCIINAAVTRGDFKEAWSIVQEMEQSGHPIDCYTISIMMKALKTVKDPKDVDRTLQLLDSPGLDICSDEVLLNAVLETCIRHRELKRLESTVLAFAGSNLQPSLHTYGSLIKAHSTLRRVDQCRKVWQSMTEHREPNQITLGCMLDALVSNDNVEDAVTLFNTWKSKVQPNAVMYSTLFKGFANTHQAARAMDLWKEIVRDNVKMTTVVYNTLVDSQARVGAMDEVSEIVASMEANGCVPDRITLSTICKGYCIKGDLDSALAVFRQMQSNNMATDSIMYNTVLDGCTRHNRLDLADAVLADFERLKIKPSHFTIGVLVKMYGRRKQLNKAFEVVEQLPQQHGFKANTQNYTGLICACISNREYDRAMQVLDKITADGQLNDPRPFNVLISALVRDRSLENAVALVKRAYGLQENKIRSLAPGQWLDQEPIEQLFRELSRNGMMQTVGVPLSESLRLAKVPISIPESVKYVSARSPPWAK